MGVHPPLELSHYQIKFAATSLYDTSVATLYVVNPHLSVNSLTHSVPRIGSGDSCPVGPTSFEFLLPPGSSVIISPSVGTVLPGKVGVGPRGTLAPQQMWGQLCPSREPAGQGPLWPGKRPSPARGRATHAVCAGTWLHGQLSPREVDRAGGPQSR